MRNRRVVITGMGAVTPVGLTARESWQNVKLGVCGVGPIFHDALSENKGALFRGTPFRKDKVIYGDLSFGRQDGQPWAGRSAVAAAAYLSCSRMLNRYDGVQHEATANRALGATGFSASHRPAEITGSGACGTLWRKPKPQRTAALPVNLWRHCP